MYYAIDKLGNRVYVEDANKTDVYFCPICNGKLRVREGNVNVKHFAHIKKECFDNWNYDMSEWHYNMQLRFPEEQREVVVKYGGVMHRADILYKDMIIEFQHSPISLDEIRERNRFYTNAGYKVAWVFDLCNQYNEGRIEFPLRNDNKLIYKWRRPMHSLSAFSMPREDSKDVVLFLYWIDEYGEQLLRGCISHPHSCHSFSRRNWNMTSLVTPLADSNSLTWTNSIPHFIFYYAWFSSMFQPGKHIWFGTLIS